MSSIADADTVGRRYRQQHFQNPGALTEGCPHSNSACIRSSLGVHRPGNNCQPARTPHRREVAGTRLHNHQGIHNTRRNPTEAGKNQAVGITESEPLRRFSSQHTELVAQRQDPRLRAKLLTGTARCLPTRSGETSPDSRIYASRIEFTETPWYAAVALGAIGSIGAAQRRGSTQGSCRKT
jgi:hypothetical protein